MGTTQFRKGSANAHLIWNDNNRPGSSVDIFFKIKDLVIIMFRRIFSTLTQNQIEIIKNFKSRFNIDSINTNELTITYSRSSGPGGQNVNKGTKKQ